MRSYIGSKIINARLMTYGEYVKTKYKNSGMAKSSELTGKISLDEPGYLVIYPPVGKQEEKPYISWSPKEVFENAYRLVLDSEKSLIVSGE